jgi:hypothetical protein
VYISVVDCTSVPVKGVMHENADHASGLWATVCILHTVARFISRVCLEGVGTEYHVLFAVVAVRCVCAMYCLWNICGGTGFVCSSFRSVSSS